jgi:hypothetical protein
MLVDEKLFVWMDGGNVKRVVESLHFASPMQVVCVCVCVCERERERESIFFKFQDHISHIGDNCGLDNHRGESGRMMSCTSGESFISLSWSSTITGLLMDVKFRLWMKNCLHG